jgi:hypothetical protein
VDTISGTVIAGELRGFVEDDKEIHDGEQQLSAKKKKYQHLISNNNNR